MEKTLDNPLDNKEIKLVIPKGNQSWIFIGRSDAKVETPILWPPDVNNWLIEKAPNAGKGWGQEQKGTIVDKMVGWHHWLDEHEFEQAMGVHDGQGTLECCSPWGHKELDMSEQLNWTGYAFPISSFLCVVTTMSYLILKGSILPQPDIGQTSTGIVCNHWMYL